MRGIPPTGSTICPEIRISPAHAGNTVSGDDPVASHSDQPRTCGEYWRDRFRSMANQGSAPHMRGILRGQVSALCERWISPAHAGNTCAFCTRGSDCTDQPRTCGEYFALGAVSKCGVGSAPHMRGIPRSAAHAQPLTRISPAHAGNTFRFLVTWLTGGDQPRTCGEYHAQPLTLSRSRGSAPHMRGIPLLALARFVKWWISPAHAGNTSNSVNQRGDARDQPRTCGEYPLAPGREGIARGSAPHMRGIPHPIGRAVDSPRISPAHAGNTPFDDLLASLSEDQPRTCGEYRGSGRNRPGPRRRRGARISPAHAGNTPQPVSTGVSGGDQPRTCGEYCIKGT